MAISLLVPLAMQVEQRRISDTERSLNEVRDAIMGFAAVNGRLPRPATSSTNGVERGTCTSEANCTGFVPWTTLGITQLDAYGKLIRYSVTPAFADAAFSTTTTGTKTIQTRNAAGALVTQASSIPAVIWSVGDKNHGTNMYGNAVADGSGTNTDEDTNNGATTTFVYRIRTDNVAATGGEYDDIVSWLASTVLISRTIAAGKLP